MTQIPIGQTGLIVKSIDTNDLNKFVTVTDDRNGSTGGFYIFTSPKSDSLIGEDVYAPRTHLRGCWLRGMHRSQTPASCVCWIKVSVVQVQKQ